MTAPLAPVLASVHVRFRMTEPDDIIDMPALRAHIDALDAELIALFARRRDLIDRAAQIKAAQGLPARIDWRVDEVVQNARRNAAAAGLDEDLFADIWRRLVEAAIAQEDRHLKGDRQ
jgi:isochorismate pyruvate lyase